MRRALSLVAALLALLTLAACGGAPTTPGRAVATATAVPTYVEVPDLGISSTLIDLHLGPSRELEAPPLDDPGQAGWYADGVRPGDLGPAVIAAHVNAHGTPGLFVDLHTLSPGALVHVRRADDSVITFRVTNVERFPKAEFPTARVYGDLDHPGLRLITCGGEYDPAERRYLDNWVAFAEMV